MKLIQIILIYLIFVAPAYAGNADFAHYFEVDLEQDKLPSLQELRQNFQQNRDYNTKYSILFDLQGDFEPDFYKAIASYGMMEKRLKPQQEDLLIDAIKQIPSKYYQYIGPQLFLVPGMSEKVLNLPGIKETKNQFPTRIAEEVKDIKDIEFLSPWLYFLLMPVAWPSYDEKIEYPHVPLYFPKIKYNPRFYAAIKKLVPPDNYAPNGTPVPQSDRDNLRTLFPTRNSTLTSGDVKAVIDTLDNIENWIKQPDNQFQLAKLNIMLATYEMQDDIGQYAISEIRNMVNPCSRFVQQVRIMGREREIYNLIAPKGFTLNEWAYTCDKTIKAYRLSHINYGVLQALRLYQRGVYDHMYDSYSPQFRNVQLAVMQAYVKGYQAPLIDVLAVKKNRRELDSKIKQNNYTIFGHPVFFD